MTEDVGQIGADGPLFAVPIDVEDPIDEWDPIGVECRIDVGGSIDAAGQELELMAALIEDGDLIGDRGPIDGVDLTDADEAEIELISALE